MTDRQPNNKGGTYLVVAGEEVNGPGRDVIRIEPDALAIRHALEDVPERATARLIYALKNEIAHVTSTFTWPGLSVVFLHLTLGTHSPGISR